MNYQHEINVLDAKVFVLEERIKKLETMQPYLVSYELNQMIKKDKVRAYVGLEIKDD